MTRPIDHPGAAQVLRHIKTQWWDVHYPPDVFVGGPDSDDGVQQVVEIREMIDLALAAGSPRAASLDLMIFLIILGLTMSLGGAVALYIVAHFCIWPVAPWCSW